MSVVGGTLVVIGAVWVIAVMGTVVVLGALLAVEQVESWLRERKANR